MADNIPEVPQLNHGAKSKEKSKIMLYKNILVALSLSIGFFPMHGMYRANASTNRAAAKKRQQEQQELLQEQQKQQAERELQWEQQRLKTEQERQWKQQRRPNSS